MREAISGTIRFDGQLLETGSIQFSPHEHAGVASGAIIVMLLLDPPPHAAAAQLPLSARLRSGFGLLWLVLMMYKGVVAVAFLGAFIVTVVIFALAFFVREY